MSKRTITKEELKLALQKLEIEKGMTLEVHSSLSSFGELGIAAMIIYQVTVL